MEREKLMKFGFEKYMNRVDERRRLAPASTRAAHAGERREAPHRLRPRRRVWHAQPHQGLSGGQKVKLVLGSAMGSSRTSS